MLRPGCKHTTGKCAVTVSHAFKSVCFVFLAIECLPNGSAYHGALRAFPRILHHHVLFSFQMALNMLNFTRSTKEKRAPIVLTCMVGHWPQNGGK